MKKYISLLLTFAVGSVFGADQIITADTANTQRKKLSAIQVSGGQIFTSNSVTAAAVVGVTNSAGSADAGKIPKLDSNGTLGASLLPVLSSVISTNYTTATGSGSSYTWATIMQLTTTATNGAVIVEGRVTRVGDGYDWMRIRDASTNIVAVSQDPYDALTGAPSHGATIVDALSGSAKTYYVDVASAAVSAVYTNINANSGLQAPPMTNGLGIRILQIK